MIENHIGIVCNVSYIHTWHTRTYIHTYNVHTYVTRTFAPRRFPASAFRGDQNCAHLQYAENWWDWRVRCPITFYKGQKKKERSQCKSTYSSSGIWIGIGMGWDRMDGMEARWHDCRDLVTRSYCMYCTIQNTIQLRYWRWWWLNNIRRRLRLMTMVVHLNSYDSWVAGVRVCDGSSRFNTIRFLGLCFFFFFLLF